MAELTFDDHMRALKKANAAGDTEAAAIIRAKATAAAREEDAKKYRAEAPTGFDAFRANVGAGFHSAAQGLGQLTGMSSGKDVREANKVRRQLAEDTPLGGTIQFLAETVPSFLVPAGTALKGAKVAQLMKAGAVGGLAGGLTSATENDNILEGKLKQGATGAALGALGAPLLSKGLDLAGRGVGRAYSYVRPEGAASRAADEMLERAATEGGRVSPGAVLQRMETAARESAIPGAELPTAALVQSRPLTELHRFVRNRGGEFSEPLQQLEARGNQARANYLRERLSTIGGEDLQQLQKRKSDLFESVLSNKPMAPGTPRHMAGMQTMLRSLPREHSGKVRTALEEISNEFDQKVEIALRNNDWTELHKFRKSGLDDRVNALKAGRETNAADDLAIVINHDIRPSIDALLEWGSGGASRQLIGRQPSGALAPGAKAMQRIGQVEEGNKLLNQMEGQVGVSSLGDPQATSAVMTRRMREMQLEPATEYGGSRLSPNAMRAVNRTEAQSRLLGRINAPDIGVPGSQTANLLENAPKLLKNANRDAIDLGGLGAAGAAALATHWGTAGLIVATRLGEKRLAQATMRKVAGILSDPNEMRRILLAAQAGRPLSFAEKVSRELLNTQLSQGAGYLGGQQAARAGSGGGAIEQPEEQ